MSSLPFYHSCTLCVYVWGVDRQGLPPLLMIFDRPLFTLAYCLYLNKGLVHV
jgi:hypothetical protein